MTHSVRQSLPYLALALAGALALPATAFAMPPAEKILSHTPATEGNTMTHKVSGAFDVKMIPKVPVAAAAGATIGRMLLDKQFHGPLQAASTGQMLAMRTAVPGSAGFVAMELVVGTLQGRSGSFVLQHSGTMNRGVSTYALSVVPDSGTGELTGLVGTMVVTVEKGQHFYDFSFSLP